MRPRGIRRLFRFPSRSRADVGADIREEFAFHVDMRVADLVGSGMPEEAARGQASREFGDPESGARRCAPHGATLERRRLVARLASELKQDVAYGLRLMSRSPGFSAVAIATLAVTIAGNTAIFSVVNALLFKPAPFAAPRELARIYPGESCGIRLSFC